MKREVPPSTLYLLTSVGVRLKENLNFMFIWGEQCKGKINV